MGLGFRLEDVHICGIEAVDYSGVFEGCISLSSFLGEIIESVWKLIEGSVSFQVSS
jgi:hypothetical protein